MATELSIIGCSGMTHELFDHTSVRQTVKYDGVMQETCVTVTLMKFFTRMMELTGQTKYADAVETAFYNAYLGALNVDFAAMRGPITLAADSRMGKSADSNFSLPKGAKLVDGGITAGVPCLLKMEIEPTSGEPYTLVDYASAGRDWETLIAAWLPTEE